MCASTVCVALLVLLQRVSQLHTYTHSTSQCIALPTVYTGAILPVGWQLGVVVSVVGRINEVNQHRARLVHDG